MIHTSAIDPTPPRPARFPSRWHAPGGARRTFGPFADHLGEALWRCDPLADDLAAEIAADPAGFGRLERALRAGVERVPDASPALTRLLAQVEDVPAWVDWGRIRRGGETFLRTGMLGGFVLGAGSLMAGYAQPAGNKPLAMSGRLETQASRRLAETSRFVWQVTRPGGLRRDGEGFAITVKVRLMHAMVRRLLWKSGRWDAAAWGEPINQHDMMGTLLLFSSVLVQGTRKLGCDVRDDEADDLIHLWRYVGHLIGVEPELAPASLAEAHTREQILLATQGPADDDGRALALALLRHVETSATDERVRKRAIRQQGFAHGLVRGLLGDSIADQLGIRDDRWKHVVPAIAAVTRPLELARRAAGPVGDARALHRGLAYWAHATQLAERGTPAAFTPPRALRADRRGPGEGAAGARGGPPDGPPADPPAGPPGRLVLRVGARPRLR